MPRTEITGDQVLDRSLTGADLNNAIGIYDETKNYSAGNRVFWGASFYTCTSDVTGGTTGDLSNAPNIDISHWSLDSSSGITSSEHRALNQLVHAISEDSYYEITRVNNKVTNECWYTSTGKTLKIRECIYTYTNNKVSQILTKQYNALNTVVETFTETINRTGNNVTSIGGVLS